MLNKPIVAFFICVLVLPVLHGQSKLDSLLEELDQTIEEKDEYINFKNQELDKLKEHLNFTENSDDNERFKLYAQLSQSYLVYDYDSALYYASLMLDKAYQLQNKKLISEAKTIFGKLYVGAGLFIEAKDTLSSIQTKYLSDSLKVSYYYTLSRVYFDIAEYYQKPFYLEKYTNLGMQNLDSAIYFDDTNTFSYYSNVGLKFLKQEEFLLAENKYITLFDKFTPTGQQYAIDASTLAFVYKCLGQDNKEIEWLAKAAIEDIKIANKDYVALRNIAQKLFEQGNITKASKYLNIALDDAKSFGALQREYQIAQIKPVVEAAKLDIIEHQRNRIRLFAITISLLSIIIIITWIVLFYNFRVVRSIRNQLQRSNNKLKETNTKLRDDNLIKEEYIGYFFKTNSDFIEKLDNYRQSIENRIRLNKIQELSKLITPKNIANEREELFRTFDTAFLNIYPSFIKEYNKLFDKNEQIVSNSSNQLNTDMRIFALIRLGISDTDKIAHILNYSVNTINTYKTRIKNSSNVVNEEFEKRILEIQSN